MGVFAGMNTAFGLVLSASCACASGLESVGGTGTVTDPYRIATAAQLITVGLDPNLYGKHFVLANDINLDPDLPGGKVFTQAVIAPHLGSDTISIPDFTGPVFTGTFDGKGHTIKNLTVRTETGYYLGLFGKVGKNAIIRNLIMETVRISSSGAYVNGLVGYNRGHISECHVAGSISGGAGQWCSDIGLLTGLNWGAVNNCTATGTIEGGNDFHEVGGLVGKSFGSIADCHADSNLSLNGKSGRIGRFGGLVGVNEGSICRSYATGKISCGIRSGMVGGLAGYNTGVVVGSYANADVSADRAGDNFGGLVGMNRGHIVYGYASGSVTGYMHVGGLAGENSGSISQCYATGQVVGGEESWLGVGGLMGDNRLGDVTCSFWDAQTSRLIKSAGGTGLTTAQMTDRQVFLTAGWDFASERANGTADVWLMPQGEGTPLLRTFSQGYQPHKLQGTGTPDEPYKIATADDLGAICRHDRGACYKLMADVDLAGITWTAPVIPSFEGRFDGNGFTISNLSFRGDCFLGLFGVLWSDAVVERLQIDGGRIVAGDSASGLGLLAVENRGQIADCRVAGDITGGDKEKKYAGIVGKNYGTITNCDPIGNSGPYTTIITDPKATRQFLKFKGMRFDDIWIPEARDLDGLDGVLRTFLDSDTPIKAPTWMDREYVLGHLRRYNREYSGYIRDGAKYVICQMHLFYDDLPVMQPPNAFAVILDGGCGVVRAIFNAETKAVVSIECNGM